MKKGQVISSLVLIPCAFVSGFQQTTYTPVRRRLDVDFRLSSTVVKPEVTTEKAIDCEEAPVSELPTVLQGIVDERAEFRISLGRAMDTLRRDYPEVFRREPDYSIYDENINVVDPSGVQLTGLKNYKASIRFFQSVVKFLYCQDRSSIQMRMVPDFCLSSIRISWHAKLVPRFVGKPLHIDGVSMYHLDSQTGKIDEHRIDQLYINRKPLMPPYGILSRLMQEEMSPQSAKIPVGVWG